MKRQIGREDILDMAEFGRQRAVRRRAMVALKADRRVAVGPIACFHFENYDTMWWQIHEMLFVERGGEAQIIEELAAYAPLVPQGNELVATLMLEIEDADRRPRVLGRLGGIDRMISLQFDNEIVAAVPETDIDRNRADGSTSAVHFLRFPMTAPQAEAFRRGEGVRVLAIDHPHYTHRAVIAPEVCAALAADL